MVAIADGLDFLVDTLHGRSSSVGGKLDHSGQSGAITMCYLSFVFGWFAVFGKFSSMDFSAIVTCASCVQCMGFSLLTLKVRATKSVAGLSSGMLVMFSWHLATRLTSTSLKNGYIPVDKSGDFMYQFFDALSLALVLNLLYAVHKKYMHSYQEEFDTLPLKPMIFPCVVVACFVHGTFNKNKFFDVTWAISTNLETFTLVPQLWMLAKMGGKVDNMTGHFVACIVASTVMQFTFWWWTGVELEKRGPNPVHQLIMGMQILKLILGADFMYYYTMAWFSGTQVVLPNFEEMEM